MRTILILVAFFLTSSYTYSQSKIEIEERIEKKEIPLSAQNFIDSLYFFSKIKWFVEQEYNKKTYEAKTKSKGKKYSIEFDSLGQIEDIELEIKWNQIPISTQNEILKKLNTDFEKHKIKKIQIQYTGKATDLISFQISTENLTIKYEIVLKGQKKSKTSFYEYLFSAKGELENEILFEFRNTDHLEY